jgi:hypothetical protein
MSAMGRYSVDFTFPRAGRYAIAVDFVTEANNGPKEKVFVSKYLNVTVSGEDPMQIPHLDWKTDKMTTVGMPQTDDDKFIDPVMFFELQSKAAESSSGFVFRMIPNGDKPVYEGECVPVRFDIEDAATVRMWMCKHMHVSSFRRQCYIPEAYQSVKYASSFCRHVSV